MSAYETILAETADGVLTLTMNRPDALNAVTDRMRSELTEAFKSAARDDAVRCVVLTGAGRAFCSGQDLADLKGLYASGSDLELGEILRRGYNPLIQRMRDLEKPIIAAVNGVAAGAGASLALACDLRITSDNASFIQAFIAVGLIPDSAATFFLPRLVGLGRAMEMCITGDKLSAADALAAGLVNRVVPVDELPAATKELAVRLASMPTRGIALTKRLLNHSYANSLEAQLEAEAFAQATAGRTADHREGVAAFLEKRKPKFEGK